MIAGMAAFSVRPASGLYPRPESVGMVMALCGEVFADMLQHYAAASNRE
jgi:hypothetical protein